MKPSTIHVVADDRNRLADLTAPLLARGASFIELRGNASENDPPMPLRLARMFDPGLLALRGRWSEDDHLVVVGWRLLPILGLIAMRWLAQPRTIMALGANGTTDHATVVQDRIVRLLNNRNLCFATHTHRERDNRIHRAGVDANRILHLVRRSPRAGGTPTPAQFLGVAPSDSRHPLVVAVGDANRDYDLLVNAVRGLPLRLVICASKRTTITARIPDNVQVLEMHGIKHGYDLIAAATAVVFPLRDSGGDSDPEALLQAISLGKPVIASWHEDVTDYLGLEYPALLEPNSQSVMHDVLRRLVNDPHYLAWLQRVVMARGRWLKALAEPGEEILSFLLRRDAAIGGSTHLQAV